MFIFANCKICCIGAHSQRLLNISGGVFSGRFDVESSAVYNRAVIRLEQDIFSHELASSGQLFVYQTTRFWSQIKSAG